MQDASTRQFYDHVKQRLFIVEQKPHLGDKSISSRAFTGQVASKVVIDGIDREFSASFDREGGATRGGAGEVP